MHLDIRLYATRHDIETTHPSIQLTWSDSVVMANTSQTPDLQSILASLAQFSGIAANNVSLTTGPTFASTPLQAPTDHAASSNIIQNANEPLLRPQSRADPVAPRPMINPASITTWQDGLRCVTKIAAQNAEFANSIRKVGHVLDCFFPI